MAATAELKKIKLNINNIRSVLLDGKKTVDEKQKERQDFLDKLEEDRKKSQEEKGLEKPMKPTKKPEMKSPVKSASSIVDKMYTFIGAILGGILVNALPGIIEAVKKVVEKVKPIFSAVMEGLKPVFEFISGFMPEMDAYETDKAKADADIAAAQNQSEIIGKENEELGLVSKNIEDENKALSQSASDLNATDDMLGEEKTSEAYDDEDEKDEKVEKKDDNKMTSEDAQTVVNNNIEVEKGVTDDGLTPTTSTEVVNVVNEKPINEELEEFNKEVKELKLLETFKNQEFSPELVGKEFDLNLPPSRIDYPQGKAGFKQFKKDFKEYHIKKKKNQINLIKPSEKNNNGITALNNTDGLTTINGSSSKTVVVQRQVVEKIVTVPV
tara:strand:+ start:1838 stop:2986 length:1149 start_codon:yes stop_codon:yes gene_type:complete